MELYRITVQNFNVPEFLDSFHAELTPLHKFSKNLVVSNEQLSVDGSTNDQLRNVTIVSLYRPYYDWIVSFWSQFSKMRIEYNTDPSTWPWENPHDGELKSTTACFQNSMSGCQN